MERPHRKRVRGHAAPGVLHYRHQLGLTQTELAQKASCGAATVRRIEAGQAVDYRTIEKLAAVFSRLSGQRVTRQQLLFSSLDS